MTPEDAEHILAAYHGTTLDEAWKIARAFDRGRLRRGMIRAGLADDQEAAVALLADLWELGGEESDDLDHTAQA